MTQTPRDKSASRGGVKQGASDLASYLRRKRRSLLSQNRPKSPQSRKSRKGEGSFLLIWSGDYLIDFFNAIFFFIFREPLHLEHENETLVSWIARNPQRERYQADAGNKMKKCCIVTCDTRRGNPDAILFTVPIHDCE